MKIYERFIDDLNLRIFNISFTHSAILWKILLNCIIHLFRENYKTRTAYRQISITITIITASEILKEHDYSFFNFEMLLFEHFIFWLFFLINLICAYLIITNFMVGKERDFLEICFQKKKQNNYFIIYYFCIAYETWSSNKSKNYISFFFQIVYLLHICDILFSVIEYWKNM